MNKRNHYTPEFKAKIIMEVLKEAETISQITQKYGIHGNMISKWEKKSMKIRSPASLSVEKVKRKKS